MNFLIKWFMANFFIDAVKQIEKQDFMTQILKQCFKQSNIKDSWSNFLDGIERLLVDAKDEVQKAREWK